MRLEGSAERMGKLVGAGGTRRHGEGEEVGRSRRYLHKYHIGF